MEVLYVTILLQTLFISSSVGRICRQDLITRLSNQERTIDDLIRRVLHKPCSLLDRDQSRFINEPGYGLELTIQQAIAAFGARKIRDHLKYYLNPIDLAFKNSLMNYYPAQKFRSFPNEESEDFIKTNLPYRRSNKKTWNKDFYLALSRALQNEMKRSPELRKVVGNDIETININNPLKL